MVHPSQEQYSVGFTILNKYLGGIIPPFFFIGETMAKRGLYANIHAKRKRIAEGSGEKMRKVGSKGAPTSANFKRSAKTAKKR